MKLNEVYHLIIYCLNCIRHDQNSTYKTGLRNICNELESSIIYTSTFSKTAELDQGLKGNDNDMQVTFNMHVRLWCESPIKIGILRNPDRTRTRTRTRRKSGLEKNPDPDSKKIRTRV